MPIKHFSEKSVKLFDDNIIASYQKSPWEIIAEDIPSNLSDSYVLSEGELKVMKDFLQKLVYPEDIKSPWKLKYSASDVSSNSEREIVKVTKEDVKPLTIK